MSKITVIVPVYNVEAYLPRCIDSILAQTFEDFELILVDDGSTDRSGEICDEYAAKDSRIRVIRKENGGVSSARNAGIMAAEGDYVAFIDSDDYVDSIYLECMISCKSDLTICGLETQNERNEVLKKTAYLSEQYESKRSIPFPKLYKDFMLYSPYCKLFRNDIIQTHGLRFIDRITWGEDGMFIADYLRYINSFAIVEQVGYYYIKHDKEESLSTKVRADIVDMIVTSREYCINAMKETSSQDYEAVKAVCSEDIRRNCSYFIKKLLDCSSLGSKDKSEMLQHFMTHSYVIDVIDNPQVYYDDVLAQSVFTSTNVQAIMKAYQCFRRKQRIWLWLYHYLYQWQPKSVKTLIKHMKQKVTK